MVFQWFPKNECLETYANQFTLVIQDLPKDTNILIHGNGIRYNYCGFGAWTMLAASNAFIILHDHDFITTKSQEPVLHIKPMLFHWFHKITCQKRMNIDDIWVSQWIKKAYDYCCFSSFVMFQKYRPKTSKQQKYQYFIRRMNKCENNVAVAAVPWTGGPPFSSHSSIIFGKLLWLKGGEESSPNFGAKCPPTLAGP